jgi:hypothetical protein
VTTELSSGAISSILEAVPGIATVLRSPVADAIVNLSRAASGVSPFNPKDAHELIKYAVRRGLIRSDEGDRVAAEVDAAVTLRAEKKAQREAAHAASHPPQAKAAAPAVKEQHKPVAKPAVKPKAAAKPKPKAAKPSKPAKKR